MGLIGRLFGFQGYIEGFNIFLGPVGLLFQSPYFLIK